MYGFAESADQLHGFKIRREKDKEYYNDVGTPTGRRKRKKSECKEKDVEACRSLSANRVALLAAGPSLTLWVSRVAQRFGGSHT